MAIGNAPTSHEPRTRIQRNVEHHAQHAVAVTPLTLCPLEAQHQRDREDGGTDDRERVHVTDATDCPEATPSNDPVVLEVLRRHATRVVMGSAVCV